MARTHNWWQGKEYDADGRTYRRLCEQLDRVDITVEQFASEVEKLIVAASGTDAYGQLRDPFAPLAAAERDSVSRPEPRPQRSSAPTAPRSVPPPDIPDSDLHLEAARRRELVAVAAQAEARRRIILHEQAQPARDRFEEQMATVERNEQLKDRGLCRQGHIHSSRLDAVKCDQAQRGVGRGPIGPKRPPSPFSNVGWAKFNQRGADRAERRRARARDRQRARERWARAHPRPLRAPLPSLAELQRTSFHPRRDFARARLSVLWPYRGVLAVLLAAAVAAAGYSIVRSALAAPYRNMTTLARAVDRAIGDHVMSQNTLDDVTCSTVIVDSGTLSRLKLTAAPRSGYAECRYNQFSKASADGVPVSDFLTRCTATATIRTATCTLSAVTWASEPSSALTTFPVNISADGKHYTFGKASTQLPSPVEPQ